MRVEANSTRRSPFAFSTLTVICSFRLTSSDHPGRLLYYCSNSSVRPFLVERSC